MLISSDEIPKSTLKTFLICWSNFLSKAEYNQWIAPLASQLVGHPSSDELDRQCSVMMADWLVRVMAPTWLRTAGYENSAKTLENLPAITVDDPASLPSQTIFKDLLPPFRKYDGWHPDAQRLTDESALTSMFSTLFFDRMRSTFSEAFESSWLSARDVISRAAVSAVQNKKVTKETLLTTVHCLQNSVSELGQRMVTVLVKG
jgi:hypothetical protein